MDFIQNFDVAWKTWGNAKRLIEKQRNTSFHIYQNIERKVIFS